MESMGNMGVNLYFSMLINLMLGLLKIHTMYSIIVKFGLKL
jgi:hypothetical protein